MILGGDRGPGDKSDSSVRGTFVSNLTFPRFIGFFRNKQNQMSATDNAIVAIPPITPVGETVDMRSPSDIPERPAYRRRLHLYDLWH